MNSTDYFAKGDKVNVKARIDDLFTNDFTGTVVEIKSKTIVVRDQDDDCWEVDAEQLTKNK